MFGKEQARLEKTLKKVAGAKKIFTDTVQKLMNANDELTKLTENCEGKIMFYTQVQEQAKQEIDSNVKLIGRIQEILE